MPAAGSGLAGWSFGLGTVQAGLQALSLWQLLLKLLMELSLQGHPLPGLQHCIRVSYTVQGGLFPFSLKPGPPMLSFVSALTAARHTQVIVYTHDLASCTKMCRLPAAQIFWQYLSKAEVLKDGTPHHSATCIMQSSLQKDKAHLGTQHHDLTKHAEVSK